MTKDQPSLAKKIARNALIGGAVGYAVGTAIDYRHYLKWLYLAHQHRLSNADVNFILKYMSGANPMAPWGH